MKWLEYKEVAHFVIDAGIEGWPSELPEVLAGMLLYCSMIFPHLAKQRRRRLYKCGSEEELAELNRFRVSSRVRDVRWVLLPKGIEITARMAKFCRS